MKVLVAEDNASIRNVIVSLLSTWGYEVEGVEEGLAAWAILERDPPPLVVLDWMMPGLDGMEICRRIRKHHAANPPYVIFLTCRDTMEDLVAGLQAGANDYITKPFEAEELRARLQVGLRVVELQAALTRRVEMLHRQGKELTALNRALRVLYEAGQALVRAGTEQELLQDICRLLVETGGYRLAWVGYSDGTSGGEVRPQSFFGQDDMLRITWGVSRGSTAPAPLLVAEKPAIARNVTNDPYFAPLQGKKEETGYAAVISLPLHYGKRGLGELHIYSREENAFDDEEARLLVKLANDLAFGIVSLRSAAERQKTEEELQAERDRAQLYLDVAGVLMVALNGRGQITLVNAKGCEILGYREEELIGRDWFANCLPAAVRDEARRAFSRMLAGELGADENFVQAVVTRNGAERLLEIHNALLRDPEGAVDGILFSGADITERRKAEEALRESERNYRSLFDQMVTAKPGAASAYKTTRGKG